MTEENKIIGNKRTNSIEENQNEEIIPNKRSKRDSIKSEGEESDSKSVSSEGSKKTSGTNVSSSTAEPGSMSEDRSDSSENLGPNRENVTLFWFTEAALRMNDNPGLTAALQHCKAVFIHFFLFYKNALI